MYSSGRRETPEQMAESRSRSHRYSQKMNLLKNMSTTTEISSTPDDVAATSAKPNSRYDDRISSYGSSEDEGDADLEDDGDDDDDNDKDINDNQEEASGDNLGEDGQRILSSKLQWF